MAQQTCLRRICGREASLPHQRVVPVSSLRDTSRATQRASPGNPREDRSDATSPFIPRERFFLPNRNAVGSFLGRLVPCSDIREDVREPIMSALVKTIAKPLVPLLIGIAGDACLRWYCSRSGTTPQR